MNNHLTYRDLLNRFKENNICYDEFDLQEGAKILITEYGGRVFGPFYSEDEESISWINESFSSKDGFSKFYHSDQWNLGGDRIWIAPEIQFSVKDRENFWETLKTPAAIDPGSYKMHVDNNCCILQQHMELKAYNIDSGIARLDIERVIKKADNPLRKTQAYKALGNVLYAGYEQKITLHTTDDIYAEAWNLIQLNPGGRIYISASPTIEYVDYYEKIDCSYQSINPNHVRLSLTGDRRYKVGYKAAHVFGRVAYVNQYDENSYYLVIKCFFNNPSSVYTEEPPSLVGDNGYSVHVYNDDGNFGGFGELECNLQTIGKDTGIETSTDQILTWFYRGEKESIDSILFSLMGIRR